MAKEKIQELCRRRSRRLNTRCKALYDIYLRLVCIENECKKKVGHDDLREKEIMDFPFPFFSRARALKGNPGKKEKKRKCLPSGRKIIWDYRIPQTQKLQIPHQTPGKASRW